MVGALQAACAEPTILQRASAVRMPSAGQYEALRGKAAAQLALEAKVVEVRRELIAAQRNTRFDFASVQAPPHSTAWLS